MKKRVNKIVSVLLSVLFLITFCACSFDENNSNRIDDANSTETVKHTYDVDNSFFTEAAFSFRTYSTISTSNSVKTSKYIIVFTSTCDVSLYKYTAQVKLFSNDDKVLESQTITETKDVKANMSFSFSFEITQQIWLQTKKTEVIFNGKSYDNPSNSVKKFKVTFVYNNGDSDSVVSIEKGKTVSMPSDPKKSNYTFLGWYTDSLLISKYDFSKSVVEDITLYAKFEIDAAKITNEISTNLIKGVVKIYNKSYNTFLGIETSSSTCQGSGFCFDVGNGNYYLLTNCHVAKKDSSYDKQKFTIEDYQGKTYTGYLYKNPNKSNKAIDASYDLACLYFSSSDTQVKKLTLDSNNAVADDDVISLGSPKSQSNAITFGKVCCYKTINLSNTPTSESNVKFDVVYHNAYINNGSSGGPLLNANLKIVGVNYAGNSSTNNGYAIPIEKVKEFLQKYVYN